MRRSGWLIFLAFLGGIVLANLSGKEVLAGYGILNEYYLNRYSWHALDCDRLFCNVFVERLKDVILLMLLERLIRGRKYVLAVLGMLALGIGYLMTVAIVNFGVKGILVILAGVFPQWIFYLLAIVMYGRIRIEQECAAYRVSRLKEFSAQAVVRVLALMLVFLGILAESYLNPILFDKIVKFF